MKKAILTVMAGVVLGVGSGAVAQTPAPRPAAGAAPADAAGGRNMQLGPADGEAIFKRICAACHMQDAKGAVGAGHYPALAGNPNLAAAGYPTMVVVKGLNGMPAIGAMLTDQQVADVVNYVRSHFGNKFKGSVTAADVKPLR